MTWRLVLAVAGVAALVLTVVLVPLGFFLVRTQHDSIVAGLERDAFVLAGRSVVALGPTPLGPTSGSPTPGGPTSGSPTSDDGIGQLTDLARQYRTASGARVVVTDAAGVAIVTSDDDEASVGASYLTRPEIKRALGGAVTEGTRYSSTLGLELLYVAVPVWDGARIAGAVRLTYPAHVVTDASMSRIGVLAIVGITAVALSCLVGWILARSITARLRRLTELTERFASGMLDETADEAGGAPELRSLARSFNAMSRRVTDSLEQQTQFASDASHQLRTPLTGLRLRLDRARDLLPERPQEAADRLAAAEDEVDRLDGLVSGLLQLSRTESDAQHRMRLDVAAIARERARQWAPLAQERGLALVTSGAPRAEAITTASIVEHILDAYLDNALAVAPPGSTVDVRVDAGEPGTSLHVLDAGPGMPKEHLEKAFQRFWRGREDEGTGLGLSLVARLARMGGIEVELRNRPEGGIDAIARFAAPPPPERRARWRVRRTR